MSTESQNIKECNAGAEPAVEIAVKSAGYGQQHDYRWMGEENGHAGIAMSALREREELLDDRHPSVLISREADGASMLLVKSLPSKRVDFSGTPLRNAFAVRVPRRLESMLRPVAAAALTDPEDLARRLDDLIHDDPAAPRYGFQVEFDGLRAFLVERASAARQSRRAGGVAKVGSYDAEALRADLAGELLSSPLPEGYEIPVLVTRHCPPVQFTCKTVWRGLAECFPDREWRAGADHSPAPRIPRRRAAAPVWVYFTAGAVAMIAAYLLWRGFGRR